MFQSIIHANRTEIVVGCGEPAQQSNPQRIAC